jgi:hypothetical protein
VFDVRYEVFIMVKIQVEVFWIVMLHSVVVRYQCIKGIFLKWYPTAALNGGTSQKTLI